MFGRAETLDLPRSPGSAARSSGTLLVAGGPGPAGASEVGLAPTGAG